MLLLLVLAAVPVRWVEAPQARVFESADQKGTPRAMLPIGVEVRVLREAGTSVEIEALDGTRGFVSANLLAKQAPVLEALPLERATALAPTNLDLIERFAAAQKKPDLIYLARKGWVAARRRSLSWDGPLYPIDEGRARFPAACDSHEQKPTGPTGMEGDETLDEKTAAERRRAFRWVSSGKVVSVSERGYLTEHLRAPRCDGERLAYPVTAQRGALVPSWMVAGVTVTPVRDGIATSTRRRVELSVTADGQLKVVAKTFTTSLEATLPLKRATAAPIAVFSDTPAEFMVLLSGPACAPRESAVSLVRATLEAGALKLEEGRPWGCAQTPFTRLEGEPRDVSREALLDEGWKR